MDMTQMLKGLLEGCLLGIIASKEVYGYELATILNNSGLNVSDGSIYPLLLKMQKEGLIIGELKPSNEGPMRKYYQLTEKGVLENIHFKDKWSLVKNAVDKLVKESDNEGK